MLQNQLNGSYTGVILFEIQGDGSDSRWSLRKFKYQQWIHFQM